MKKTRFITAVLEICGMLMFSQCGMNGSLDSSSSSSEQATTYGNYEDAVGGNVTALTVENIGSNIDFEGLGDDEDIVLVLYSYNSLSSYYSFEVEGDDSSSSNLTAYNQANIVDTDEEDSLTESFHEFLRDEEEAISGVSAANDGNSAYLSAQLSVGEQRSFVVLNSFYSSSSYETVTATLRASNSDIELYVDNRDADSLSDDELEELADQFAGAVGSERDLLGEESDVNGDGKVACLFTRVVNKLGGSQGGIVTGFVYALDVLDGSSSYPGNDMEVMYTFVPDESGEFGVEITNEFATTNIYPGVMVHEFGHIINFNQHYFVNGGAAENGWLNEGLSHLIEDIYTADDTGFMAGTGLENPSRVASFLSNISNACFTCGTSLTERGGSYLFVKYLYEQAELGNLPNVANGTEFLNNIVQTSRRGIDNIESVAFGSDTSSGFKDLLGNFSLAIYLSGTDLVDDNRFNFSGIDLRGIQDDNRGTVLSGPAIQTVSSFPFTDSVMGNGVTFLQISGSLINESGGAMDLSFASGSDFGGYVIRQ